MSDDIYIFFSNGDLLEQQEECCITHLFLSISLFELKREKNILCSPTQDNSSQFCSNNQESLKFIMSTTLGDNEFQKIFVSLSLVNIYFIC